MENDTRKVCLYCRYRKGEFLKNSEYRNTCTRNCSTLYTSVVFSTCENFEPLEGEGVIKFTLK